MDKSGGGFYADLGSDTPDLYKEYSVVRTDTSVDVPSLQTKVEPEMWIATAELRHIHQSLGHFKLTGKRWVKGAFALARLGLSAGGHWEDYDKKAVQVATDDFVLKKTS
ncbi:MAG: hypothetical protein IID33_04745 [Planctomycetes bacterium]|nr:hypothetical protein [Planctomycetota bacterium]